jgi:hypothetical protein
VPFWKDLPRAVDKRATRATREREDQRAKTAVRQADRYRCRVCGRGTKVVHEHPPRSLGTRPSLASSFCACDVLDGGVCHPLLQRHRIVPVMADGRDRFHARGPLLFEMTEAVAVVVFKDRPRPPHVRIVDE